MESNRPALCVSLDKWGLQITPAAVGRAGGVEGTRLKVLLPVFCEWLPEGSYENSSQPCPSRRLTSSTPLQQNGTAYQLTQWGVISTHPRVSGHNIGRSWNEIVLVAIPPHQDTAFIFVVFCCCCFVALCVHSGSLCSFKPFGFVALCDCFRHFVAGWSLCSWFVSLWGDFESLCSCFVFIWSHCVSLRSFSLFSSPLWVSVCPSAPILHLLVVVLVSLS